MLLGNLLQPLYVVVYHAFDGVVYLPDRIAGLGDQLLEDVRQELVFIEVHRRLLSGEVQENFR